MMDYADLRNNFENFYLSMIRRLQITFAKIFINSGIIKKKLSYRIEQSYKIHASLGFHDTHMDR